MSLISKETLLTHLQRAEMASNVQLPIEFFRDLVYQAMPRTWVGLTYEEETELIRLAHNHAGIRFYIQAAEAKSKEKNGG